MYDYDIYVLCEDRSLNSFEKFRSHYLIHAKEETDEYIFPYLSDNPEFITDDLIVLFEKLFSEKEEEYGVYWSISQDEIITTAMMFFTNDGYLIYGLSVHKDNAEKELDKLKNFFSSQIGKIVFEQPPQLNSKIFAESLSDEIDW